MNRFPLTTEIVEVRIGKSVPVSSASIKNDLWLSSIFFLLGNFKIRNIRVLANEIPELLIHA